MTDRIEPERYEFNERPRYQFRLSRRAFVQTVGAGLLITTFAPSFAQRTSRRDRSVGARFRVGSDGRITAYTGKVEVGQGSRTQITQAVAEELRMPVDQIVLVMADTDLVPNDGGTYGSLTTPRTVPTMRNAAGAARELLIELAAEQLGVKSDGVEFNDGIFVARGAQLTLAELAGADSDVNSAMDGESPRGAELTDIPDWDVLGESVTKSGGHNVVTGAQKYASDLRRPGMVYGKMLRPPAYGATLRDVDPAEANALEGVEVVRDGDFVGCVAPTSYQAQQAIERLAAAAEWDRQPHPSSDELSSVLKENVLEGPGQSYRRAGTREQGDVDAALSAASEVVRAEYAIAYIQHAPMETRSALAEWDGDNLTVWTGTQRPFDVRDDLARAFSISSDKVRLIVPDTGGGFGGKHIGDAAIEAARLAKEVGKPVSVQWTRDEEFMWAYFRPAGVIDVAAGLDDDGRVTSWDFTNYNSGGSALECPYAFENTRVTFIRCDSPLREGSYRGLAATANNFAREAFIDRLAKQAGEEPLAFRLKYLRDERMRGVLQAAADKHGWDKVDSGDAKIGHGIACGTEKGSFLATCAEVEMTGGRNPVKVRRVTVAFDCGPIHNPANLNAQIVGSIIMGLGGALREAIEFENGKLLNGSFQDYKVPRFEDLPEIEVVNVVPDKITESAGAGETPIIAVAPAIANAIFAVTGSSPTTLPITRSLA